MRQLTITLLFCLCLGYLPVFAEETPPAEETKAPEETKAEETKEVSETKEATAPEEAKPAEEPKPSEEAKAAEAPKEELPYQPIIIKNEAPKNEPVKQTPPDSGAPALFKKETPKPVATPNPVVTPNPNQPVNLENKENKKIEEKKVAGNKKTEEKQADTGKDKEKEEKAFIKGELSNAYAKEIIYPYNSIGVRTGITKIEDIYYLTINPTVAFNKSKAKMGFHVPLNIELLSTDTSKYDKSEQFTLRKTDWDEWEDYLKVIKYFQYGGTEDNFFVSVGQNFAYSLGHGTIMKRYISNFDPTTTKIAGKLNYYNDYMGFETVAGDIPTMTTGGALFFIKPLSLFCNSYQCTSLSFGYTIAGDRKAPSKMAFANYSDYEPSDYFAGKDDRPPRLASSEEFDGRPDVEKNGTVYVQGVDAEFKFFKNNFVDIKGFLDYSWIDSKGKKEDFVESETEIKNDSSTSGGFTAGFLGRFNIDEAKKHNMRVQLEFRHYDDSYIPSFFDSFYEAEQYEMLSNIYGKKDFSPDGKGKYSHLISDSEGKKVQSYYTELTYSYKNQFATTFGLEKMPKTYNLFGHVELPDLYFIKAMMTYSRRGLTDLGNTFEDDPISTLMRGVVRLEILPILFINSYVGKQWIFWPEKKVREDDRLEGHFLSMWDWGFNIEVGYEF